MYYLFLYIKLQPEIDCGIYYDSLDETPKLEFTHFSDKIFLPPQEFRNVYLR